MPEYVRTEEHLLDLIYEKYLGYKLDEEEQSLVKSIDNDLLYYDLKELLNEVSESSEPELLISLSYEFVSFAQVEQEYLNLFNSYFGG